MSKRKKEIGNYPSSYSYRGGDRFGFEKPLLILVGVGLLAGGVYLLNKKIRYKRLSKTEENTLENGTVENIAKRLKLAIGDWWDGADEAGIFKALSEVDTKETYAKVQVAYERLTGGRSLNDDLGKNLSSSAFDTVSALMSQKKEDINSQDADNSQEFARQLKEGVEATQLLMPDTDIDLIFDVFHLIPNQKVFESTKIAFKEMTRQDLWQALEAEWRLSRTPAIASITSRYNDWGGVPMIDMLKNIARERFGTL
jgi:hypothetical protein